ncbi:Hypothetical protein LUCI_1224 [Lucifera butyrica]|uniref:AraC family transcriptional regulator n=1 Tax=Lucifera butyrica TaxID=1351585 RepID=A0A498R772_9FIRM|nr:CD1247 N-terminal domain-containing protein [Lucifera butyrica]VBB06013.1 Hypothetical protein LUCI_1224 [Lucifera butyrica]
MGNFKERVAYLQGLTKGLNVSDHSAEGKLLLNIIDVLDDLADEFNNIYLSQQDLETYVEKIDEDLTDLENEVYDEESYDEEAYDSSSDEDLIEVNCPVCHETVTFDADLLNEAEALEVTCPSCGGVVYDNTQGFETTLESRELDEKNMMEPGI